MSSEAKKPSVNTSVMWYTALCMLAGVAMAQIEVSTWLTFILEVMSQLFERITDVIAYFLGMEKPK